MVVLLIDQGDFVHYKKDRVSQNLAKPYALLRNESLMKMCPIGLEKLSKDMYINIKNHPVMTL